MVVGDFRCTFASSKGNNDTSIGNQDNIVRLRFLVINTHEAALRRDVRAPLLFGYQFSLSSAVLQKKRSIRSVIKFFFVLLQRINRFIHLFKGEDILYIAGNQHN